MRKISKAKLIFVLAGVAFLLSAGGAFMLFNAMGERTSKIAALKSEAQKPEELQATLDELNAQAAQSAMQLAHLEKGIPELAYVPTMLKELEAYGNNSGIKVHGVRPFVVASGPKDKKTKKTEKPYTELNIEVKGKGRYRSVLQFVKALQKFPKIVAVRTVTISPKNDGKKADQTDYSNLDITIELRAFLFKPQKGEEIGFPEYQAPATDSPVEPRMGIPPSTPKNDSPAAPANGKKLTANAGKGGPTNEG